MDRASFVYDVRLTQHVYRPDHPLRPERLRGVHATLTELGAFDRPNATVLSPRDATRDEIERIHAPDYVEDAAVPRHARGVAPHHGRDPRRDGGGH